MEIKLLFIIEFHRRCDRFLWINFIQTQYFFFSFQHNLYVKYACNLDYSDPLPFYHKILTDEDHLNDFCLRKMGTRFFLNLI